MSTPQNPVIHIFTSAAPDNFTPSAFVPLIVPTDCTAYLLKNQGPDVMFMRSDPNDPTTEDTLGPGGQESFDVGHPHPAWGGSVPRWFAGSTLYYVKCTGPVVGKFWL